MSATADICYKIRSDCHKFLIFNHIGNRKSRRDAGLTQSNASGKPSELSDTHSPLIHPLPKKKHLHHVIRAWRLQLDALPLDMVLHFT
jgi:hypothetical protein